MSTQKQRNSGTPETSGRLQKAVTGNPDAASAAAKANAALTKLAEPANPAIEMGWCRDGIQRLVYAGFESGMVCWCLVDNCNLGPFIWRT